MAIKILPPNIILMHFKRFTVVKSLSIHQYFIVYPTFLGKKSKKIDTRNVMQVSYQNSINLIF